jgi:hypothetical protein
MRFSSSLAAQAEALVVAIVSASSAVSALRVIWNLPQSPGLGPDKATVRVQSVATIQQDKCQGNSNFRMSARSMATHNPAAVKAERSER